MPLNFLSSSSSPFDDIVERATAETLSTENWDLILSINDKVNEGGSKGAKDCLLSLKKRLNHRDPHVVLFALSVLDSCLSNCGKIFRQEACTRELIGELKSKATGSSSIIADKVRELLKKWVDEFKADTSISLLISLYNDLKKSGIEFSSSAVKKSTSQIAALENALREQEELNKASTSLYPSGISGGQSTLHHGPQKTSGPSGRVVKALYDFEAAEDNELTFKAGDLINVLDDSDVNWWKGVISKNEGLFPASFVTADLSIDVDQMNAVEKKKSVKFDDNVKVETIEIKPIKKDAPKIDVEKLNYCFELLQNSDPTGEREDPSELLKVEEECLSMAPLIDGELVNFDQQISQLSDVNMKLLNSFDLYHRAMSDTSNTAASTSIPYNAVLTSPSQFSQPTLPPMEQQQLQNLGGYQQQYSGQQQPMGSVTGYPAT